MVILRRIGVRSAGQLGFWLGIALATVNILIFLIFLFFIAQTTPPAEFFVRAIVFTFFSGVQTAFSLGMFAYIYNIIARNFGGLELDFDMPGQSVDPENKRKNDDPSDDDDSDAKESVEIV